MSTEYTNISVSNAGRKRSRVDYFNEEREVAQKEKEWSLGEVMGGVPESPMPFVNTRYKIKGGLDTPGLKREEEDLGRSEYSDVGYRRELSGRESGLLGEETGGYQSFLPLDLERESSGRSRRSSGRRFDAGAGDGWSKTALEVVGGMVGKVWEFCKMGAGFRGFTAGGGKGYKVRHSTTRTTTETSYFTLEPTEESSFWTDEKITSSWEQEGTLLPGRFPEEHLIADYMDRPTPEVSPERPVKRRQISTNSGDDLTRNWVVVPAPKVHTPAPKPQPQLRGPARYSMPTASSASRRSVVPRPSSRASTVAPRRPTLQRVSHAGSPALNANHGASFASPRSPGGSKIPRATNSPMGSVRLTDGDFKPESPAAKEAARWAAVKRKEEREADVTIRRLDAQLKAMIREGKEALGTKVEIEDDL